VRRPRGFLRKVLLFLLALTLLLFCAALALVKTDFVADEVRELVVREVSEALDADLSIGRLSLKLFPTGAVLEDVELKPRGRTRLFSARRVEARIRPLELLRRRVHVDRVIVDGAEVTLDMLDGQIANLVRPKETKEPPSKWRFRLDRAQLHRGSLRLVGRASAGPSGRPMRRVLERLARAVGGPPPRAETALVARASGLDVDVWGLPGPAFGAQLALAAGSIDLPGLHETVSHLRARAFLLGDRLTLHHFELGLGESQLAAFVTGVASDFSKVISRRGGRVEGRIVLAAPAGRLRHFVPRAPALAGKLVVDLTAAGTKWADFLARGRVRWEGAQVGPHRLRNLGARLTVTRAGLAFEDARVASAAGALGASGRFRFGAVPTFQASVQLRSFRLAPFLAAIGVREKGVDLTPSGSVEVSGRLPTVAGRLRPQVDAVTELEVRNLEVRRPTAGGGQLRAVAIPLLRVSSHVEVDADRVRLHPTAVRFGGYSSVRVQGEVQTRPWLRLEVASDDLRLEDVGVIAGFPWSGRGRVRATISGSPSDPLVLGSFDIAGLNFERVDLERAAGLVEYSRSTLTFPAATAARGGSRLTFGAAIGFGGPSPSIKADVEILQGRGEELVRILRLPAVYGERYGAEVRGDVHLRGTVGAPTGWGKLTLSDVSVYGERFHEVVARGSYSDSGWTVDEVTVRKTPRSSRVEAYGVVSRAGELSLVAVGQGLALADFGATGLARAGVQGEADLYAQVQGTIRRPEGTGRLTLRSFQIKGIPQQDSSLRFSLAGDRLDVQGQVLGQDVRVRGEVVLRGALPFHANVALREFEFTSLVRGEARNVFGKATGSGEFSGNAAEPSSVRGRLALEQLVMDVGGAYTVHNRGPVVVALQGGKVVVESLEIAGRDTEIALTGTRSPGGEIDLEVQGKVDLNLLSHLTKEVQNPAGILRFKSKVTGTDTDPSLLGNGELVDGRIGFEAFPHQVSGAKARLVFTQNKVVVQDFTAAFADGTLRGDGDLTLKRLVPSDLRFSLRVGDAQIRYPEDFPSRIEGIVHLTGDLERLRVVGDLRLIRARYAKDVKLAELLLKRKRVAPRVFEKKRERIAFSVRVVAPDDIRIVNNLANLEFRGELEARGTNRRFGILGALRLVRPGVIKDKRNTFKVERAFVVFKDEDKIDPYLDIEGVTRVRQYDVVMTLKGRLSDLKVDYSCGSGLAREDCVALVRVGLTLKEMNAVAPGKASGLGTASTAIDTLGAVTGFDEKVAEAVPIFDTFRIGSGYSEYAATIVPLLTIGKQITNDINVSATTSLVEPSRDFRAQVELNLRRNLLLTGEYAPPPRTSSGASVGQGLGNLGVDLKWRFEF
jgi:translocation and assembly module TamB